MSLKARIKRKLLHFTLDLSLELRPKDYTVMIGPSGAGKSMTLKILAGLEEASDQKVVLNDKDISTLPPERRSIVYLPQGNSLFPHLSVFENLLFVFKAQKVPVNTSLLDQVIDSFKIRHLLKRKPIGLSGGETQRVALARAICANPRVLLLDEPLSFLDFHIKLELVAFLRKLPTEYQIAVLHVTHDPIEAALLAKRIYLLRQGQIAFTGSFEEFLQGASEGLAGKDQVASAVLLAEALRGGLIEANHKLQDLGLDQRGLFQVFKRFADLLGP